MVGLFQFGSALSFNSGVVAWVDVMVTKEPRVMAQREMVLMLWGSLAVLK